MQIFHVEEGTTEDDELALVLVKDYEDKNIRLPKLDPIEAVKLKMEERGIKAKTLNLYRVQRGIFHLFYLGKGN